MNLQTIAVCDVPYTCANCSKPNAIYPGNEASYTVQVGGYNQSLSTVLRIRPEASF